MVDLKDIQATCDDIVREFAPLKIILFGSYADGTPTEDSAVDLLVVMPIPESQTRHQAVEIRRRIPRRRRSGWSWTASSCAPTGNGAVFSSLKRTKDA